MQLIFIYGLPATGKLTVAQELSKITGYRLFHNHLVVDLALSVFDFGTPPFIRLREETWLSVFDRACAAGLPGLIFTFNPETTVQPSFVPLTIQTVVKMGGQVTFIELVCPLPELRDRIDNSSRLEYRKLTSLALFDNLHAEGTFDTAHMPEPFLTIDTNVSGPVESAARIAFKLGLA